MSIVSLDTVSKNFEPAVDTVSVPIGKALSAAAMVISSYNVTGNNPIAVYPTTMGPQSRARRDDGAPMEPRTSDRLAALSA